MEQDFLTMWKTNDNRNAYETKDILYIGYRYE